MLGARAVAALATDALGQPLRVDVRLRVFIAAERHVWIGVVAEHAFPSHLPCNPMVTRQLEARGHGPRFGLRVPRERQLIELADLGLIEVGPRMFARTEDPVHLDLEEVDLDPLLVQLVASEEIASIVKPHLVVSLQRLVVDGSAVEVLDQLFARRAKERLRHGHVLIAFPDIVVTEAAR